MTAARRLLLDRGGLLGLVVLALYVWLAPAHVVDGDNAEFATLGALGGVAHPSGYPLYVLWLRAMSWLPGESPAHTTAIATALLGAASIVVMHAACRAWGARPFAASLACAIFAASPVVLAMYTEAEVFALNGLVVAAVLWLAARGGPVRATWRAVLLGLVAGLGLSNHLTCALVAPVGIYGVVLAAREGRPVRALAAAVGGLALGLLPYAYLFVAPEHEMSWGHVSSLHDLVRLVMRSDYGGPAAFAPKADETSAVDQLLALASMLGRTWVWLPAIVGLGALVERIARARGERWPWVLLGATFVLAGPLIASRFNTRTTGVGLYVVHRFHILPALLLAIPVASALDRGLARLPTVREALAAVLVLAVLAACTGSSLSHVRRVHVPAVEDHALNLLHSLPPNAVLVGAGDDLRSVTAYAQLALGVRQDVDYVHQSLLKSRWYQDQLAARGFQLDDLVGDMQQRGRPTFMATFDKQVFETLPHYPYGLCVRVLPRGQHVPTLDEVIAINTKLYRDFDLDYPRPGPDDEWASAIQRRYARTWELLADELEKRGRVDEARSATELARAMGPQ